MVKEHTSKSKTYYCDKCGWPYSTREGAEACEAKEPERIYVDGAAEEWKSGDIALKEFSRGRYRLILVDHEYESHHRIYPFWVPVDDLGPLPIREDTADSDWGWEYTPMHIVHVGVRILNDKQKERLIHIGKVLEGGE